MKLRMNKFELLIFCHVYSHFPTLFQESSLFYSSHWIKTVLSISNLIQSFHKTNSSNNNILVPPLPRNFETWKFNLLNRRIIKFEMAEALKRARSGHLGTITRTENSMKEILEKEPSTLTLLEISKIKSSLERCREQVLKNQTNASSTNWLKMTQSRKRSKLKRLELMIMVPGSKQWSKRLKWPKNGSPFHSCLLAPLKNIHGVFQIFGAETSVGETGSTSNLFAVSFNNISNVKPEWEQKICDQEQDPRNMMMMISFTAYCGHFSVHRVTLALFWPLYIFLWCAFLGALVFFAHSIRLSDLLLLLICSFYFCCHNLTFVFLIIFLQIVANSEFLEQNYRSTVMSVRP